jgi:gamma-glutamyltranspeptidase/glutathione hydrolase
LRTELEPVLNFAQLHLPCAAPPRPGDRYNQPALEGTLRELSRSGLEDFYRGTVARRIASELAQAGSALQLADLAAYSATVRDPLRVRLSDSFVYNLRPPSQGIASLLILGVFERLGIQEADGFEHVHALVEATKQAFIVRDRVVGHRSEEPLEVHLEPQALDRLAGRVDPGRAIPWPSPPSGGDTVWFGVIDAAGRCVSAIQSLYFPFGSGVALPESGFVWQNRGCAFKLHGDGPNVLAPGRKPFHTLNPAFAQFSDGRRMVYGSMGGDGQPQFQAAVFTRYARFRQDLQTAVSAPRWLLGRTWGETRTSLRLERRFGNTLAQALIDAGHDVELIDDYSETMGHAGALVRHADRRIAGASDPRSDGAAFGV